MNGVDISGVVGSGGSFLLLLIPIFVIAAGIGAIASGLGRKAFIGVMIVVAVSAATFMVNLGAEKAEQVGVRALVSEHYQVEYPLSKPLPKRGGQVEVSLGGKDDRAGTMTLYRDVVVKRAEDDIITLWVPKGEGATEFVELGSESGASEYAEKERATTVTE